MLQGRTTIFKSSLRIGHLSKIGEFGFPFTGGTFLGRVEPDIVGSNSATKDNCRSWAGEIPSNMLEPPLRLTRSEGPGLVV